MISWIKKANIHLVNHKNFVSNLNRVIAMCDCSRLFSFKLMHYLLDVGSSDSKIICKDRKRDKENVLW